MRNPKDPLEKNREKKESSLKKITSQSFSFENLNSPIIENFPDPIIIVSRSEDKKVVLKSFNRKAQELFEINLSDAQNKELKIFWPYEYWKETRSKIRKVISEGSPKESVTFGKKIRPARQVEPREAGGEENSNRKVLPS
ncbi:MAG: PAS domain-containing protein [Bacteroidetes bacterium]|nr:PAS domain-containing protein [Bacteroidota bacterium]